MMAQRHKFVNALSTALRRRCGVQAGGRLLAAVSGGVDSVALLRALVNIARRRGWRLELAVGHVQHHLRDFEPWEGEVGARRKSANRRAPVEDPLRRAEPPHNSDAGSAGASPSQPRDGAIKSTDIGGGGEEDAMFVERLAEQLELPFFRADLDLSNAVGNIEAAARRGRYDALSDMAEAFGSPYVVCAHQADDQLETLLMRMLRGASVVGLSGMAWCRRLQVKPEILLIRPMLAVDRASAEQFLCDIGQTWCEDHTNRDLSRLRARLRHEVLPVLRAIRPDAAGRTVNLADHLRAVGRVVQDAVEVALDRVVWIDGAATFDRTDAKLLPRVVLVGLLRQLLATVGATRDKLGSRTMGPMIRAIRDGRGGERRFDLSGNVCLQVTRDTIRITTGLE